MEAARMKRLAGMLAMLTLGSLPVAADTIYQTTPQGRQVVMQRGAIVIQDDSSMLTYKHFDLPERRVVKVSLRKGLLPYQVSTSPAAERQQIVQGWKRFSYRATLTDQGGQTTILFNLFLDFYPPGGRGSLLEVVPPRTTLPVSLDRGGADEIEFSKIERILFQGDHLKLTLRDGQVLEGRFLMPTDKPAEARFLGMTDHYDPASKDVFDFFLPLAKVKEVQFQ
jgi:hypothetical protein